MVVNDRVGDIMFAHIDEQCRDSAVPLQCSAATVMAQYMLQCCYDAVTLAVRCWSTGGATWSTYVCLCVGATWSKYKATTLDEQQKEVRYNVAVVLGDRGVM